MFPGEWTGGVHDVLRTSAQMAAGGGRSTRWNSLVMLRHAVTLTGLPHAGLQLAIPAAGHGGHFSVQPCPAMVSPAG